MFVIKNLIVPLRTKINFKFVLTIKFNFKQKTKQTIMKKSIALVAMSFGVTSIFAQDLTSKKGEPFLPEAGDYAISIDANPFLNYVGNFFGKTANNVAPTWNFLNGNNMIIGKKFKDATTAYRAGIRIGYWNNTTKAMLVDQSQTTAPTFPTLPSMKEDVMKSKSTSIGLMAGIEKRKGKTRLQGLYGADFMIWTSSTKQTYEYGQTLDPAGSNANLATVIAGTNTQNFGANIYVPTTGATATSGRVTSKKVGNGFGLGLRAFVGAEYFILPKISLGGEFGWGVGFMTGGKTTTITETTGTNAGNPSKAEVTEEMKNGGKFAIDTDLNNTGTGSILAPSASLRLNLHF